MKRMAVGLVLGLAILMTPLLPMGMRALPAQAAAQAVQATQTRPCYTVTRVPGVGIRLTPQCNMLRY